MHVCVFPPRACVLLSTRASCQLARPTGGYASCQLARPTNGHASCMLARPTGGYASCQLARPTDGHASCQLARPTDGCASCQLARPTGGYASCMLVCVLRPLYASRMLVHPTHGFTPPACRTRLPLALPSGMHDHASILAPRVLPIEDLGQLSPQRRQGRLALAGRRHDGTAPDQHHLHVLRLLF